MNQTLSDFLETFVLFIKNYNSADAGYRMSLEFQVQIYEFFLTLLFLPAVFLHVCVCSG